MNLKVVVVILSLSLLFFFGAKKIYGQKNKSQNTEMEQLRILKYLPKNNNLFFYSNFDSSKLTQNINTQINSNDKENLNQIKNSILAYLGIDIGTDKLKDIYNNEFIISFFENKKNTKKDVLIIFKIKPEKDLNDLLNLSENIYKDDQIVPIYRENKLNYLKFIYQTKDNYIITSSNKKLIQDSISISNYKSETYKKYSKEIMGNFKNQKNILFSKKYQNNLPLINQVNLEDDEDIIATIFSLKDKDLILKSYLINNNKNLDITYYDFLINKKKLDYDHQISIYSDLESAINFIKPVINKFERSFLEELGQSINYNVLLLNSDKEWVIAFENNNKIKIEDINKIKNFNKYSLEKNDNVYSIYTKDIIEVQENMIKQISYKDIFTAESEKLSLVSNSLIDDKKIDEISEEFFNIKKNILDKDFNFQKVEIKGSNFYKANYFDYFNNLNFLFNNILNLINEEFLEIIKQSIPENSPVIYTESRLRILN